ncbi:hypothetical protein L4D77_29215 [Photobacterium frigidiphilum]|uniref:hypothetical protein n=1 Tax=Photobacterium frigidiphilum TaxID=264736 RepID=UPI003D11B119
MNRNIQLVLNSCENLNLKVNSGEKYRITKNTIKSGSLWLEVQQEAYRLKLTGEVKSKLHVFVNQLTDIQPTEDQGDPVWHLPFTGYMEKVVNKLNEI